jgi:hypothetical protein
MTVAGDATPLAGALTCRDGAGTVVDCDTGNVVKATLKPADALIPGQHYVVQVNPSGVHAQIADLDSNPVDPAAVTFRADRTVQETTPTAVYTWRSASNASAYDGSYAVEHLAGAKATFTFTGTSVTWYTVTGPSQGLAYVYIDGAGKGSFNQYASSTHFKVARSFSGLSSSAHTIQVVVRGLKGSSAGTNTNVAVDGFKVGTSVFGTPTLSSRWRSVSSSSASGGSYVRADLAGARASFTFRGTGVDWYTMVGPDQGKAEMWVDGVLKRSVDNYAASRGFLRRSIGSLSDSLHTLVVKVLGQKRSSSTGYSIAVDRWVAV